MPETDPAAERKRLYRQQTFLRQLMADSSRYDEAMRQFYAQHAQLHAAAMSQAGLWSFSDYILHDLAEAQLRHLPPKGEHSLVWCFWHITLIEDTAMNMLIAGSARILFEDDWLARLRAPIDHTGNIMDREGIAALSRQIDIEALLAYRQAVGRRTREIAGGLSAERLNEKVDPARLERVMAAGALVAEAQEIADYWSKRTVAGLLLMPATRHNLVHLNEALQIKEKWL